MYTSGQKSRVLGSLAHILQSEGFANAPQLRNFLEFIVDKALNGQEEEIKGYTIGVDALGRPADFDPHTDPVVRVMAGRLRQALTNYYNKNPGSDAPLIEMTKGNYVPRFVFAPHSTNQQGIEQSDPDALASISEAPVAAPRSNSAYRYMLATLMVGMIALAGWYFFNTNSAKDTALADHRYSTRISISVRANNDPLPDWFSIQEAQEGLVSAFTRFKEFAVYLVPWDNRKIAGDNQLADYNFDVLIARAGTSEDIRAFVKLTHEADGAVIWSRVIPIAKSITTQGINSATFAGQIIAPLLSPYGVIYSDLAKHDHVPSHLDCINKFYTYFAAESSFKYTRARSCLEGIIKSGNATSSIYSLMTFLQLEVYRRKLVGFEKDPLNAAELSARQAIVSGPQNARSHQALFGIHKIRGHQKEAIESATHAIDLNPYDSDIIGDFAAYLVSIGKFERATPMLKTATKLNPTYPAWLEFFLFLNAEFTNDFAAADNISAHTIVNRSPLSAIVVILAAHRQGNIIRAKAALKALLVQEPGLATDPAAALTRRGFSSQMSNRIATIILAVDPKSF